jgi:APA family basic amino acid/polyamine antiporter
MNGERPLGLPAATALVVTAMIGTGVFTTSGLLLQSLGSRAAVLAVWAAGGLVAALGALCYAALARRLPESGGEYLFLSRTLHPVAGCLAGYVTLLAGFAAPSAAAALAFAEYLRPVLPAGASPRVTASLLLAAAVAVHAISLSAAARLQTAAVVAELALILAFLAGGASHLPATAAVVPAAMPPAGAIALGLVVVSYSYSGWNQVVYLAGEVRDPLRTLPRALVGGALLVTLLYLALNTVFLFAVPPAVLAGRVDVGRLAAETIGGPRLAAAVSALIAYVLVTFVSSMTMAGPHICARMGADGYLPRALAAQPGRPPRAALAVQLALGIALVWTAAFDRLLTYVGFALGLSTAATVAGLVRLRRRLGAGAVPVWGWPWVPALFLIFVLSASALAIRERPWESAVGLGLMLVVALVSWPRARRAAHLRA